jgi:hypothetical protein
MRSNTRKNRGHITEFAAALIVLVCFFLVPLLDMGFVPVRYWLASGAASDFSHKLSHCEKRTDAYDRLLTDTWWQNFLGACGVTVSGTTLKLIVCGNNASQEAEFAEGQTLPPQWLPNGQNGPCVYSLDLETKIDVSPFFRVHIPLPLLDGPLSFKITSRSQWENLACDPTTMEYYVNE